MVVTRVKAVAGEDALLVLRAAERLVKGFLVEPKSTPRAPIRLVPRIGED
jgi:hypothetical protein